MAMNTISVWLHDQLNRLTTWWDRLSTPVRQAILVVVLLLFALIMGILLYVVFFKPITPELEEANTNVINNIGQLPPLEENINGVLVNAPANANVTLPQIDAKAQGEATLAQIIYTGTAATPVFNTPTNSVQFYDPADGKFYRVDANGNLVAMSDQVFKGVEKVTWSNDTTKSVLEFQDGYKLMYDFEHSKQYTLDQNMQEFSFSPNDTQIGFKFIPPDQENRWLGVANADGSQAIGIEPLGDNGDKVTVAWSPAGQAIATFAEYSDGINQTVIPIGLKGENFKQFTVTGRNFQPKWSPDGQKMLYSTYSSASNYNPVIHIVDAYGDNIGLNNKSLDLTTSVDKCTFNKRGTTLYCAVPVNPPQGGGIATSKLDAIPSDVYKVDLSSGISTKIATPADYANGTNLNGIKELMVNDQETTLYYREAETGQLRRIVL